MATGKCPKCHEGEMYADRNPYNISKTLKMHEHCSHCGFRFKVEPNFFFGAMYVSYALAVGIGITIFFAAHFGFDAGLMDSFIAIFVGLILLMPVITRLSRNIYINMFVNFDPQAAKKIHT